MSRRTPFASEVDGIDVTAVRLAETPKTISLRTAAERIGCSDPYLRTLLNRGEGPPYVEVGREKRFRDAAIDAWLHKLERQSLKVLQRNRKLVRKFTGTPKVAARAVCAKA